MNVRTIAGTEGSIMDAILRFEGNPWVYAFAFFVSVLLGTKAVSGGGLFDPFFDVMRVWYNLYYRVMPLVEKWTWSSVPYRLTAKFFRRERTTEIEIELHGANICAGLGAYGAMEVISFAGGSQDFANILDFHISRWSDRATVTLFPTKWQDHRVVVIFMQKGTSQRKMLLLERNPRTGKRTYRFTDGSFDIHSRTGNWFLLAKVCVAGDTLSLDVDGALVWQGQLGKADSTLPACLVNALFADERAIIRLMSQRLFANVREHAAQGEKLTMVRGQLAFLAAHVTGHAEKCRSRHPIKMTAALAQAFATGDEAEAERLRRELEPAAAPTAVS